MVKIIPLGTVIVPNPKRYCWLRLRRHKFSEPFKRGVNKLSVWRYCTECGWISLLRVDENEPK